MIDYSFNLKNPLYNVKEVIFLTTEMTILVTLRAKIVRFLYYYEAFLAHSCLTSPPRESFCYCILKWSSVPQIDAWGLSIDDQFTGACCRCLSVVSTFQGAVITYIWASLT